MKVGIVTPRYPPNIKSGGERSVHLLAQNLQRDKKVSEVCVHSFDGNETSTFEDIPIKRHRRLYTPDRKFRLPELTSLVSFVYLRHLVSDYDIIHSYNMEIHPTIGILSYKYGIKTVATLNSYLPFLPEQDTASTASIERQLYEISHLPVLNRRILRNIDAFISLSKCVKSIYSYYGFDPKQIYQINNIIDPDFSPNKTSEHRNGNRVSLLFVGTLSKKKGPDILLRAMTLLNEYFHLRIVGDGKLKKKLKKFVQSNNLGKRVEFTGAVKYENIPQEYANSDIFVHPSPWPDPFDRTILEAMQSGLPVVTTNLGGSAEAIEDQTLLCQPGSAESLAKSIRIAEDSSSVGARNREYVESHHSPDVVVPRITSLYESLKGT